jgi:hypothetical protein
MKQDIKDRVMKDFGEQQATAIALIETFESEEKLSPRISRCIVYLAKGDLLKLETYIQTAKHDWRDVIYWAEVVPLEYNRPFDYNSLWLGARVRFDFGRKMGSFYKHLIKLKLRVTPLLVLSLVALGLGIRYFFSKEHDEEGWIRVGSIILIACGGGGLFVYFILRFILQLKYLAQVVVEIVLIGVIILLLSRH